MAVKRPQGMDENPFTELMQSLNDMTDIRASKTKPARVTKYKIPDVCEGVKNTASSAAPSLRCLVSARAPWKAGSRDGDDPAAQRVCC
jgi:hypothetical protein